MAVSVDDHTSATYSNYTKIPGCKGLRKLRWRSRARGKRGGVRILYYWAVIRDQILLIDLFAKNENDDLTPKQYKRLVEYFKREYDG